MSDFPAIGPDGSVVGKRSAPKRPSPESEGRQSNAAFDAILGGYAPDRSQALQNDEEEQRASEDHAFVQEGALAPARAGGRGSASEAVHVPDQMLSTLFDEAHPGERKLPELGERTVGVVLLQLAASPGSVTEIDVADDHAALAPAIAHHFVAMLGGTPPGLEKTAPAMTDQRATSETGPVALRLAGPEVAVVADRARLGQSGRPELPSFRITRHETHFGPAFSFPDSRSETDRHLKGEVRSGRKRAGAIGGSRMGVPSAG